MLDGCVVKNGRTASYASVMDSRGECLVGLGDMALHNHITPDLINKHLDVLERAPLVVLDGNAPQATIDHVLALCRSLRKPVFFEPTDRRKATKPLQNRDNTMSFASPNLAELQAIAHFLSPSTCRDVLTPNSDIKEIINLCSIVSQCIDFIIITMGARGVLTVKNNPFRRNTKSGLNARLYPVNAINEIENVSGAGDCFASGFIYGILSGRTESQSMFIGFQAARKALLCNSTVPSNLNGTDLPLQGANFISLD